MNVAQKMKMKYRAIRKAKLRKQRADEQLKSDEAMADEQIKTAAWKAKKARL